MKNPGFNTKAHVFKKRRIISKTPEAQKTRVYEKTRVLTQNPTFLKNSGSF